MLRFCGAPYSLYSLFTYMYTHYKMLYLWLQLAQQVYYNNLHVYTCIYTEVTSLCIWQAPTYCNSVRVHRLYFQAQVL